MGNPHPSNGFHKGQSGNPAGRKPDSSRLKIRELIHEILAKPVGDGEKMSRLEYLLTNQTILACKGDSKACRLILEYAFGQPTQFLELPEPVRVIFVDGRANARNATNGSQ